MKLKCIILTISITFILTIFLVFTVAYFLFGWNKNPHVVLSVDSPDSKTVVFTTCYYLIITNLEKFNTCKISLNRGWWKWHKEPGGTFSSANKNTIIENIFFIKSDTLEFKTNAMSNSEKIYVGDI